MDRARAGGVFFCVFCCLCLCPWKSYVCVWTLDSARGVGVFFCVAHKLYSAEASIEGRGQRKWTCNFIWFITKPWIWSKIRRILFGLLIWIALSHSSQRSTFPRNYWFSSNFGLFGRSRIKHVNPPQPPSHTCPLKSYHIKSTISRVLLAYLIIHVCVYILGEVSSALEATEMRFTQFADDLAYLIIHVCVCVSWGSFQRFTG